MKNIRLIGTNYRLPFSACDISLRNHIQDHSLPFSIDLNQKMIEEDFHIQELLSNGKNEMSYLLEFGNEDFKENEGKITSLQRKKNFT